MSQGWLSILNAVLFAALLLVLCSNDCVNQTLESSFSSFCGGLADLEVQLDGEKLMLKQCHVSVWILVRQQLLGVVYK